MNEGETVVDARGIIFAGHLRGSSRTSAVCSETCPVFLIVRGGDRRAQGRGARLWTLSVLYISQTHTRTTTYFVLGESWTSRLGAPPHRPLDRLADH